MISMTFYGISFGISIMVFLYSIFERKQGRMLANQWQKTNPALLATAGNKNAAHFFVGCASEQHYESWYKFWAVEHIALLTVEPGRAAIHSNHLLWENLTVDLNPSTVEIKWVGKTALWKNGWVKWFYIRVNGKKLYITADWDQTLFTYKNNTPGVYKIVKEALAGERTPSLNQEAAVTRQSDSDSQLINQGDIF